MQVELHRLALLDKELRYELARRLARVDVGVWHKETLGPVGLLPAIAQALFFWRAGRSEDIAGDWHLGMNSATQSLRMISACERLNKGS